MNIEKELTQILEQFKLPQDDKTFITELIEHREWGVALEYLCAAIVQEKIIISKELYKQIASTAKKMDMWIEIQEELKHCTVN
ncbi:MafI family immunity protein [Paenibacillus glycanilyticus]|uniref:MafI family immunity protein n=1 Tax=Paenibacillus glycanilyticus TaxID=126569 RepID=UPI00203D1CBA|nr:MafI family immunity protein [Paenibacillus glycanilyticus]MCM3629482.1 MafI family immunity protein [Paenibacillus glycanilyticus]